MMPESPNYEGSNVHSKILRCEVRGSRFEADRVDIPARDSSKQVAGNDGVPTGKQHSLHRDSKAHIH